MYCTICGGENSDNDSCCCFCGTALKAEQPTVFGFQVEPDPVAPVTPQNSSVSSEAPQGGGGLVSAWKDFVSSKGWLVKVLLLGLMCFVPVLNFVVYGYALQWARSVAFGKRESMPREFFADRSFVTGFFIRLLEMLAAVVSAAVIIAFLFVPYVGLPIALVLVFAFAAYVDACVIRMGVTGRIEAAFDLKKVWVAVKRAPGGLLCAAYLPGLIIGFLFVVALLLANGIVGSVADVNMLDVVNAVPDQGGGFAGGIIYVIIDQLAAGNFDPVMLVYLLVVALFCGLTVISYLITFRALGYWAAKNAPEWALEADPARIPAGVSLSSMNWQAVSAAPVSADMKSVFVSPIAPASSTATVRPAQPMSTAVDFGQGVRSCASQITSGMAVVEPMGFGFGGSDSATSVLDAKTSRLVTLSRKSTGQSYLITSFPVVLGKGTAANVCIEGNSSVSRTHARILIVGNGFVVEDLNATNGTSLNGVLLPKGGTAAIHDGDVLGLANELFGVSLG